MHVLQEIALLAMSELLNRHGLECITCNALELLHTCEVGILVLQIRGWSSLSKILMRAHHLRGIPLGDHLHVREPTGSLHAQGADCA